LTEEVDIEEIIIEVLPPTKKQIEDVRIQNLINQNISNYRNFEYTQNILNPNNKPYIQLAKEVKEALESNKYIFVAEKQGVGKTYTNLVETSNKYKNVIFIGNTHELNDEVNLSIMYNNKLNFKYDPAIINLFGKDFDKISPQLQKERGYPQCMCNFWEDPNYYLKKLNYFPSDWCSYPEDRNDTTGHCPYIYGCEHRKMINDAVNTLKRKDHNKNVHMIWLMVKAYLDTNMIDTFLEIDKPVGIIDENILGLCFDQVNLNAYNIRNFNELADKISKHNRSLREIYVGLRDIFKLIDNLITYDKDVDVKIRAKKITEELETFLQSYKINDIIKWNEKFKQESLKHVGLVKKTFNIMNFFIKMLKNNKENIDEFENYLTMDRDSPNLSLFISKIKRIREIVQKFHKLIFTDALLPTVIKETTSLLEIGENYKILHNKDRKEKWKEVKILKLNNEKLGKYSKNTLLNFLHTDVSSSFHKLIKISKQIIEFESGRNRKKGLIGSMKLFQYNKFSTNLKKELKPIIKNYEMNVKFGHYGNAEGKNIYSDVDWIILFGGYNTPMRTREIESKIFSIDMNKLEHLHGPGALLQFAHRGRPILRPNQVSLYSLTNDIKGCLEQEEPFRNIPQIEYKKLFNYLKLFPEGVKTKVIQNLLKLSNQSTLNILHPLKEKGLLKFERVKGQRGQSFVWSLT
jgi:hypothetical protein